VDGLPGTRQVSGSLRSLAQLPALAEARLVVRRCGQSSHTGIRLQERKSFRIIERAERAGFHPAQRVGDLGILATGAAPLTRPMRWRACPWFPAGPICAQAGWGPDSRFTRATSRAKRVQDWHSPDRLDEIGVNLADHAENATCPLLAGFPSILGAFQRMGK